MLRQRVVQHDQVDLDGAEFAVGGRLWHRFRRDDTLWVTLFPCGRGATMNVSFREQAIYAFGPFRLDPLRHVLLRDGAAVRLAPRLFDTLLYLVAHAGRVVEREELLRAVWHGRVVDDSNLKQTIFALRKALHTGEPEDRFIVTAPARGYVFAAPVSLETRREDPPATAATASWLAPPPPVPVRSHGRLYLGAALFALGLAASAVLVRWPGAVPHASAVVAPPPHSLAVLAFTNLSGDPAQDYFSDGISEELIAALSRVGELRVVARSSAFSFRGAPVTIATIAHQLNVGAVLEGSVRRTGAHVRITAELIDAATGFAFWSHVYDRGAGDVLQIQADVAASVAASLQIALLGGQAAKFTTGGTANPDAFDAYLRGVRLAESTSGPTAATLALPAFERAIALDANFALARARRAQALLVAANAEGNPATLRRSLDEVLAEAGRAIEIAPDLAIGHLARGAALMSIQDFAAADREMSQAHALAPGDALVTTDYALTQVQFGRIDAGVRAAGEAAALDPLIPAAYLDLARALVAVQRYDQAEAAVKRARILGDENGAAAIERAMSLDRGDYKSVVASCARGGTWIDIMCLARAYHGLGRQAEADAQLARLKAMLGDGGAFQYAEIYAQWGRLPEAVAWLQAAYRLHDTGLVLMKSDALLAPIRATPEYQDIERRLNFPR